LIIPGINVVVVGLPDKTLDEAMEKLPKAWPGVEFRKIGADLADPKCVEVLGDATENIDISLVFSNAGYIRTSFLTSVPVGAAVHNHHVNATSSLQVAHLYTSRMQAKGLKGAVCFTSSPAGVMASPFAAVYGATKAFVTEFAMSLAPEVRQDGIDVCVLHPSPMATAFYSGAHSIDSVNFFKNTAVGPARAADALCASIGRVVVCEQGEYPSCEELNVADPVWKYQLFYS
jgi:short-subunit dehydrogenase